MNNFRYKENSQLPTLRNKIFKAFILLVILFGAAGALLVIDSIFTLSGMTPERALSNYSSISAANHMRQAFNALRTPQDYSYSGEEHWVKMFNSGYALELKNVTEPGEREILNEITILWKQFLESRNTQKIDVISKKMNEALERLVSVNEKALFKLLHKAFSLRMLALGGVFTIFILLFCSAIFMADNISKTLSKPLNLIVDRLKEKPSPGEPLSFPQPATQELEILTKELTSLWERVSYIEQMNMDEIIRRRNQLEALLEVIEDASIVLDRDLNILHVNGIMCRILELPSEKVVSHKWNGLESSSDNYKILTDAFASAKSYRKNLKINLEGEEKVYSASARQVVGPDNTVVSEIYLLHDVTEERQRERLKSEFVGILAHELKTPIQSLGMASEHLMDMEDKFDSKGKLLIETIFDGVERIRSVANEFVQVGQISSGEIVVRPERLCLSDLLPGWVGHFRMIAAGKKINIEYENRSGKEIMALIDPVRFPWIISNLLSNAIRVSPADSVIEITLDLSDSWIEITVSDHGPGIAKDVRENIFDPYFQAGSGNSSKLAGLMGMGLTIAQEITFAHGGELEFKPPESGPGASFIVRLKNMEKQS